MKESKNFWDRLSGKYDNNVKKYEQTYQKTIEKTTKYLSNKDDVIDFACGTGIITVEVANRVKKIHAIDISSGMLDIAKSKANEKTYQIFSFRKQAFLMNVLKTSRIMLFLGFYLIEINKLFWPDSKETTII